jgi:hypothetical protein
MTEQLTEALRPFLEMAKACESLHDRETIAARCLGGKVVYLDVRDFKALEKAALAMYREKPPTKVSGCDGLSTMG